MKWSARVARVAGIDIKVHISFLLIVAFGAWSWADRGPAGALFGAALILVLFACVVLHELGHSLVAIRLGVPVREIILLPIGGIAFMTGQPKRPWHELVIALAGPAVNVGIAISLATFAAFAGMLGILDTAALLSPNLFELTAETALIWLLVANVSLALFNMLPAFPLDGGRVLRAGLAMVMDQGRASRIAAAVGQVFAVGLGIAAVLGGRPMLAIIALLVFFGASQEVSSDALRRALEGRKARDVSDASAATLSPFHSISEVAGVMTRSHQRDYPVMHGWNVVGVLSREKVAEALILGRDEASVGEVMDSDFLRVQADASLEEALQSMAAARARVAAVHDGTMWIGMLSRESILHAAQLFDAARTGKNARKRPAGSPAPQRRFSQPALGSTPSKPII